MFYVEKSDYPEICKCIYIVHGLIVCVYCFSVKVYSLNKCYNDKGENACGNKLCELGRSDGNRMNRHADDDYRDLLTMPRFISRIV